MISSRIKSNLKKYLCMVGMLAGFVLLVNILHTGCLIRFLTGVSCPGCGITRAIKALLELNFSKAFYYNPMVYVLLLTPIWIFLSPRQQNVSEWLFCVLGVCVYLVRLYINHPVIQINIQNGFLYEVIQYILRR